MPQTNRILNAPKSAELSLVQMLKPEVLGNPYPLYAELRDYEPVHWDPFLHSWLITSYDECVVALSRYKASRTPTPEQLQQMGLSALGPYAQVMLNQMMFMDAPAHARLRALCAIAFTPKRIEQLRQHIEAIANDLLDKVSGRSEIDLICDFAGPFPAIVTTAVLGVPRQDHSYLKTHSTTFAELMGNFDHDPDRLHDSIRSLLELQRYFQSVVDEQRQRSQEGLISTMISAEVDGSRLTDEEIIANVILVLVGGLEETTNLIGNGMWTLLHHPASLAQLREDPQIIQPAVEEFLRYEPPTQFTGRIVPEDGELGGKSIRKGDSITIVLAAANRDPRRFEDPDRLNLTRTDNRHLAFGWAAHYCFGAPLSRMCGHVAFNTLLTRLPGLSLQTTNPIWRPNVAMHGLTSLKVTYDATKHTST